MRVLWLCNIIVPQICEKLNMKQSTGGSWLESLFDGFCNIEDIKLAIVAPIYKSKKQISEKKIGECSFFGFSYQNTIRQYDNNLEQRFRDILEEFQPDIVHIFGTEYLHTLCMVNAFANPDRTIIQIQGLTSVIAKHYTLGLSEKECRRKTFRDFIRCDNINKTKKQFEARGKYEMKAIRGVKHIIGRTDWDEACSTQINPEIRYHYCPEILRKEFYYGQWQYEKCEKHSIFMSQAYYPVKGLHFVLKALDILKDSYPDIKLYIAGVDILKLGIRKGYYAKMITNGIKEYGLSGKIEFIGGLDASEMKEQFLKANVFVSASTIENESNSLSEAKMLGVPVVASFVGGVTGRIRQGIDGFLYPVDEPYMLAYYIDKIFQDDKLSEELSNNEMSDARQINNREQNLQRLLDIYNNVLGEVR